MEFNNEQLNIIFPFHVLVDTSIKIIHFGNGLKKISPGIEKNKELSLFLEINAPFINLTYGEIVQKENKLFIFSVKEKELQLKGQVLCFNDSLLFILSPVVTDSVILKQFGITLKDFAIYDGMVDTLFLLNAQKMGLNESKQFYLRLLETNQKLEQVNREIAEMNEQLEQKVIERTKEIQNTLTELKAAQAQLIQSEKMASLGELTAGIAHEIQNPLNFVNNFTDINKELLEELNGEIDRQNFDVVKAIARDILENEDKVNQHGRRLEAIVKTMMQHSFGSIGQKASADINALCDEYLRLSYHGFKARDSQFNATMQADFDTTIGSINIIPQDIGRVLLNLYNNAFYTVTEKKKTAPSEYEPTVSVSTRKVDKKIEITVKDNGNGIPEKIKDKIFQPFFTTKPAGQGTGLGLSLSYDIVKAHGGEIKVETKEGEGSEFIIQIPIQDG